MKENFDYQPKLPLKKTLLALQKISKSIQSDLQTKFDLTCYPTPVLAEQSSGVCQVNELAGARPINFVATHLNKVIQIVSDCTNYKRWILSNYPELTGINFFHYLIARDSNISNSKSLLYKTLEIEMACDDDFSLQSLFNHAAQMLKLIFLRLNDIRHLLSFDHSLSVDLHKVISFKQLLKNNDKDIVSALNNYGEANKSFFIYGTLENSVADLLKLDYTAYDWRKCLTFYYYYPLLNKALPLAFFAVRPAYELVVKQRKVAAPYQVEGENSLFEKALANNKIVSSFGG